VPGGHDYTASPQDKSFTIRPWTAQSRARYIIYIYTYFCSWHVYIYIYHLYIIYVLFAYNLVKTNKINKKLRWEKIIHNNSMFNSILYTYVLKCSWYCCWYFNIRACVRVCVCMCVYIYESVVCCTWCKNDLFLKRCYHKYVFRLVKK